MADLDTTFALLVASRWLHFVSLSALFGGPIAWFLAVRPAAPAAAVGLMRLAAGLAALSGIGWTLATIATIAGDPAGVLDGQMLHAVFFETPFGPVILARLVLLGVLVAIVFVPMSFPQRGAATAFVAGLLLVGQAWLGHAAAGGETLVGAAMIAAYACHVLAAATWVGGLPPLWFALRDPGEASWRALRRFSTLATVAVVVLVAAGTANAWFRLSYPGALLTTSYGHVLLAKLALTTAMLVLAAFNRVAVASRRGFGWIRRSVAVELGLGVAILAVAAVLGITPPP